MHGKTAVLVVVLVAAVAGIEEAEAAERTKVSPRRVYRSAVSIVEFRGTDGQARLEMTAIAKSEAGQALPGVASYTKSTTRTLSAGYGKGIVETKIPPRILRRVLKTDELSMPGDGYELLLSAVNQTMRQINRGATGWTAWEDKIQLDFGSACPREITFSFDPNFVRLIGAAKDTLMINVTTKPFTMQTAGAGTADDRITAAYRAVVFYSPKRDLCYLVMSCFGAKRGEEKIRIERTAYLSSPDGLWTVAQIPDCDAFLGLSEKPLAIEKEVPLPTWALQAAEMAQVVSVVALAAACKSSGPVAEAAGTEECLQLAVDAMQDDVSKNGPEWLKNYVDNAKQLNSHLTETMERTGKDSLSDVFKEKMKDGVTDTIKSEAKDRAAQFVAEQATQDVNPVLTKPLQNAITQFADDAAECENRMLQALRLQNTLRSFITDLAKSVLGSLPSSVQQAASAEGGAVAGGGWNLGSALTDAELAELKTRPDSTSLIRPAGEALSSGDAAGLAAGTSAGTAAAGGSWIGGHPILVGAAAAGVVGVAAVAGGGGGDDDGGGGGGGSGGSSFQGSISGRWGGSCSDFGNVGGGFSLYVSSDGSVSGSFSGSTSGSISGYVSSGGSLSASGSAYDGTIRWSGTLRGSGSSLSGSGSWSGMGCSGSWSGN